MADILFELNQLRDEKYADFQRKLIPTIPPETIIGVRTPELRKMAAGLAKEGRQQEIYGELPHRNFEENQLHAFLISGEKDFDKCMEELERFLPFTDNWATCDQMSPKIFKKHRSGLLPYVKKWLRSDSTYTVRFAVKVLMDHFLDEEFKEDCMKMVAGLRSNEYYVNMMIAWYFATALAKQYDKAKVFLEEKCLDPWVHNKTIQKAVESFRITDDKKEYLKTLRICGR